MLSKPMQPSFLGDGPRAPPVVEIFTLVSGLATVRTAGLVEPIRRINAPSTLFVYPIRLFTPIFQLILPPCIGDVVTLKANMRP